MGYTVRGGDRALRRSLNMTFQIPCCHRLLISLAFFLSAATCLPASAGDHLQAFRTQSSGGLRLLSPLRVRRSSCSRISCPRFGHSVESCAGSSAARRPFRISKKLCKSHERRIWWAGSAALSLVQGARPTLAGCSRSLTNGVVAASSFHHWLGYRSTLVLGTLPQFAPRSRRLLSSGRILSRCVLF
jgi:hypothetical protein